MPKMHLKQPGFTYSACWLFTKNQARIQKFKGTGDTKYIYKNEIDKACFQHDMAYRDFKDLAKKTASDNVLRGKAFNLAKNPKYDRYQKGLAFMLISFLKNNLLYLQINLLQVAVLNLCQINNLQMNYINQFLKGFKKEKYINQIKTIFELLILQICNEQNLI